MPEASLRPSLTPSYEVNVIQEIAYGEAQVTTDNAESTIPLHLDLYQPVLTTTQRQPTILMTHGGAFLRGSRHDPNLVKAANAYAARGYSVVIFTYRLGAGPDLTTTGKIGPMPVTSSRVQAYSELAQGVESIRFLNFLNDPATIAAVSPLARLGQVAAMDDTLTAMDWLRDNAETHQLDLSNLILFGGSAGFINSLHVAYATDDLGIDTLPVAAVVGFWGAFNLDDDDVGDDGLVFLEAGEAPLFVVHGTGDVEVPVSYGEALVTRAKEVGVPVEFIPVAGGKHGFNAIDIFDFQTDNGQNLFDRSVAFLDRMLFR